MAKSGYIGESLEALVTEASYEATSRVCREIVHQAQDVMLTTAQAATPSRYGTVRDSWIALPLNPHGPSRWGATIRNDHWLAHLLSHGTSAHEIKPKGTARGGKRALPERLGPRASAHVRGIEPHFMEQRAAHTAAVVIGDVSYPAQRRWAADMEMAIQRRKRTHLK